MQDSSDIADNSWIGAKEANLLRINANLSYNFVDWRVAYNCELSNVIDKVTPSR